MSTTKSEIQTRLLGAWRLVSWEIRDPDGTVTHPLGAGEIGQLMYGEDGRMSAQLMRSNQARFARDDWRQASSEEKAKAWSDYFGYFGTYTVDEQAKAVIHHIEGSWFPNLVGEDQKRYYQLKGEQLVLDATTAWGDVRIVWKKISNGSSAHRKARS